MAGPVWAKDLHAFFAVSSPVHIAEELVEDPKIPVRHGLRAVLQAHAGRALEGALPQLPEVAVG